jgi:hypothetical protein
VDEPPPETLVSDLEGWTKAPGDLHSGVWPTQNEQRIWYKLQDNPSTPGQKRQELLTDFEHVITELDVMYGDDEPFFGFTRIEGGKVLDAKEGKWESVDITYRRGNPSESTGDNQADIDRQKHREPRHPSSTKTEPSRSCKASRPEEWIPVMTTDLSRRFALLGGDWVVPRYK